MYISQHLHYLTSSLINNFLLLNFTNQSVWYESFDLIFHKVNKKTSLEKNVFVV